MNRDLSAQANLTDLLNNEGAGHNVRKWHLHGNTLEITVRKDYEDGILGWEFKLVLVRFSPEFMHGQVMVGWVNKVNFNRPMLQTNKNLFHADLTDEQVSESFKCADEDAEVIGHALRMIMPAFFAATEPPPF